MKTNMGIRMALMQTGVKAWEVAKYILNVSEPTYFRMMREELPEKDQEIIAEKIKDYAAKGGRKA